ncbi:anti-phage-associated helicase HerA [Enterobacter ludwigii]|uniref:anti-phage-associated helicase HerA n=1 Tax=Enterobacter ludwigii TaxID=299767 RepID=UPI0025516EB2|nr:anti-phage-associated helicase HerA [Enterobacter ludwigii]MDK9948817.1 ATP-binding protein [Enterobacter ludwigii]
MTEHVNEVNAEVISVYPNSIKIIVGDLDDFKDGQNLKVGSYIKVPSDDESMMLIGIIENFSIEAKDNGERKYLIQANPLGIIKNGKFERGGDSIALPPKQAAPATFEDIDNIYRNSVDKNKHFEFCSLSYNDDIRIPLDGNKFFNKHIAIVGSTGSGKSHTVSKVIQTAISGKNGDFKLNNSHVIIFDIHSEYRSAFPDANFLDVNNLSLPYWLLNSEELEEILLDTGERDNYNQSSIFRMLVTANKRKHNPSMSKVFYDSPVFFDINEVETALKNLRDETRNSKASDRYMIVGESGVADEKKDSSTTSECGCQLSDSERIEKYFNCKFEFYNSKASNISKGFYADGTLDKFISRFSEKINQDRLSFLFSDDSRNQKFENVIKSLLGASETLGSYKNVTIIDLSGIPFEVLSITVSLISRLIFEYGYIYKKLMESQDKDTDFPVLLVYEEAHKYVPNSDLVKYRSSKKSIERIAKEGRKYGVTLLLASQRPSEISETIFSQCNNFIAMRLTNPIDQNYVKRLLPDTLGAIIDTLPSLKAGEALVIGESIVLPSIVAIDECPEDRQPSSNDIKYWEIWKDQWHNVNFSDVKDHWLK